MALRKLRKKQSDYREKRRNPRATSRANPGGLEDSIDFTIEANGANSRAVVRVSGFAKAYEYAKWMEEGPYNLGIGSQFKALKGGEAVGPRFLQRGGDESALKIQQAIDRNIKAAFEKAKGTL